MTVKLFPSGEARASADEAPRPVSAKPKHDCPACDGTGYAKVMRRMNGQQVTGRMYEEYTAPGGKTEKRLVRCRCAFIPDADWKSAQANLKQAYENAGV